MNEFTAKRLIHPFQKGERVLDRWVLSSIDVKSEGYREHDKKIVYRFSPPGVEIVVWPLVYGGE